MRKINGSSALFLIIVINFIYAINDCLYNERNNSELFFISCSIYTIGFFIVKQLEENKNN